jgi:Cys-rich four helix bundle protein (predicted Tat secretion target)
MKRRSFVAAMGATAMAAPVAVAQQPPTKIPAQQPGLKARYNALAEASSLCVTTGQDCLRRAISQLAAKDSSLIDCAKSSSDVVAACGALAALAATGAPFAQAFARTVADLCLACKKDCDRFAQIPECAALGAACAACAAECQKITG